MKSVIINTQAWGIYMYTANNIPKIKRVHKQKFQGSGVVAPDRPVCHTGEATILL